jgi:hypothetical protein
MLSLVDKQLNELVYLLMPPLFTFCQYIYISIILTLNIDQ